MNFDRDAMRFRTTCASCRSIVGYEPSAVRGFFLLWLSPLSILTWIASELGASQAHLLLALPVC